MQSAPSHPVPISEEIWNQKYRLREPDGRARDQTLGDTFERVARAAAATERGGRKAREAWTARYAEAMGSFEFLPAGRILAGAGADRAVTLFNCFVLGAIPDDLGGIFDAVKEAALTMQAGGGIGHDFSTLRPKGALVRSIGADASGPVSFMDVWDAMCRTIMSSGARRGAMMATLRCDHPDIEDFIDAKADPARLRNFNVSVLVTDALMNAVAKDGAWDLVFDGQVVRTISARVLWERLMRATYDYAEPGVVFIDRINARNNLSYCETISATNPCGEQPLPPYGACLLGSINLARLVTSPFEPAARLDTGQLDDRVRLAVRFLDSVIDVSRYPLAAQQREAKAKRRIGLGVTGLADALIYCGARYGSAEAVALAEGWMRRIQNAAYSASAELAAEKGAFPLYDADAFLARPNVAALDEETRAHLVRHGVRNGCLTSIAPTGTISLLAGNVSSGIEPVFDLVYRRRVLNTDGTARDEVVEDEAYRTFRALHGPAAPLPPAFVTATALTPREHIAMQAALQRHVDSAISKTINCPADIGFDDFKEVYRDAYAHGLKGCTTFRPNAVTGSVLSAVVASPPAQPAAASPPSTAAEPTAMPRSGDVVYMSPPLARDAVLPGFTYKLKWPANDHAIYVTINDTEWGPSGSGAVAGASGSGPGPRGRRRPFEIFINTRNLEHYAWTVALTRMISAVFRRGGDVTFVAEELKAVFDPQGGQWMGGRYVPSLLAAIGDVIEMHMTRIGFRPGADTSSLNRDFEVHPVDADPAALLRAEAKLAKSEPGKAEQPGRPAAVAMGATRIGASMEKVVGAERTWEMTTGDSLKRGGATAGNTQDGFAPPRSSTPSAASRAAQEPPLRPTGRLCLRCSSADFTMREGCWTCRACGFSRCG
ncbi:MAG: adenosylcobalamin-dependent ribonucleoside-diphosphate reductase [Hyphomicrobium sp.]